MVISNRPVDAVRQGCRSRATNRICRVRTATPSRCPTAVALWLASSVRTSQSWAMRCIQVPTFRHQGHLPPRCGSCGCAVSEMFFSWVVVQAYALSPPGDARRPAHLASAASRVTLGHPSPNSIDSPWRTSPLLPCPPAMLQAFSLVNAYGITCAFARTGVRRAGTGPSMKSWSEYPRPRSTRLTSGAYCLGPLIWAACVRLWHRRKPRRMLRGAGQSRAGVGYAVGQVVASGQRRCGSGRRGLGAAPAAQALLGRTVAVIGGAMYAIPRHPARAMHRDATGDRSGGCGLEFRQSAHRAWHGRDHAQGGPCGVGPRRPRQPRPDAEPHLPGDQHRPGEHRTPSGPGRPVAPAGCGTCNSSAPDFSGGLVEALKATGATIAFDLPAAAGWPARF